MEGIRVLQINLQHSRAASAALTRTMGLYDVVLIQEPWVSRGKISGLSGINGELIHSRSTEVPRACIIAKNNLKIFPLTEFFSRDLVAVKMRLSEGGKERELVLGSAYFPGDDPQQPPSREVVNLVLSCRGKGSQLIIGCDANAHHTLWGSTNTNDRGESILQFIMANNLDILNVGNTPTFVTTVRKEVLDITLSTTFVSSFVKNWHVTNEVSCSDHKYISFNITGHCPATETYRNPRRTNWEAYQADLDDNLRAVKTTIRNTVDLELAAEQLQTAIISAYTSNCPEISRNSNRNVPWWNIDLEKKRKQTRKLFNKANRTGEWAEYRKALTDYNKSLRASKRESWRRHYEEVEKTETTLRRNRRLWRNSIKCTSRVA